MVIVGCANCGKEIVRKNTQARKCSYFLCSQKCHAEYQSKYHSGRNHPRWDKGTAPITQCYTCGKIIKKRSDSGQEHNFCSRQCLYNWLKKSRIGEGNPAWSEKIEFACLNCGKTIITTKSRNKKFCSSKCQAAYGHGSNHWGWKPRIKRNCAECNTEFEVPVDTNGYRANQKYCSYECYWKALTRRTKALHPRWEGGPLPYGDWSAERQAALERDSYTCQICGARDTENKKVIDVHHIIRFRIGKSNNIDNLITLCKHCHRKAEANKIKLKPRQATLALGVG